MIQVLKSEHLKKQAVTMNASTMLSDSQVLDVCEQVTALTAGHLPAAGSRALGLYECVRLVLLALRHNLTQELLAELLDVSQPTVSRVISAYTPLLARALEASVPTVEDLDPATTLVVDGTVLTCWDWKDHPELYCGKYRRTGPVRWSDWMRFDAAEDDSRRKYIKSQRGSKR